jgi:signal peptidase I
MEPTLKVGQIVYVGGHYTPRVGDVVVFAAPSGAGNLACGVRPARGQMCSKPTAKESDADWIKRVVAVPGDTIALDAGHVILNGKRETEPYADVSGCTGDPECSYPTAIKIPPGYYFMLGDNRAASADSRFWGPVPLAWIVGRAEICNATQKSCRYVR